MIYRTLGDTDLELSVITFGAWALGGWLWGGTQKNDPTKAIHAAQDHGVTSIDTAPVYGQGHSEKVVGEAISDIPRDELQILTKYGNRWDTQKGEFSFSTKDNEGNDIDIYRYAGKESVIKECEDSLRRLGTDYIDLYQIHWPDPTTPIPETMEAVAQLKEQGKIREAAVCNYSVEQMQEAEQSVSLASNQVPYSMLLRDIEEEVVPYCKEQNKGILAYSPLQRGILTGKMKVGQEFSDGDGRTDSPYYSDENIRRTNRFLNAIEPVANEHNATLAQLTIAWTLAQPGITIALVGARNEQQATQNAQAANISLSDKDLIYINERLDALELKEV